MVIINYQLIILLQLGKILLDYFPLFFYFFKVLLCRKDGALIRQSLHCKWEGVKMQMGGQDSAMDMCRIVCMYDIYMHRYTHKYLQCVVFVSVENLRLASRLVRSFSRTHSRFCCISLHSVTRFRLFAFFKFSSQPCHVTTAIIFKAHVLSFIILADSMSNQTKKIVYSFFLSNILRLDNFMQKMLNYCSGIFFLFFKLYVPIILMRFFSIS